MAVRMRRERPGDPGVQHGDLRIERTEQGHECKGDLPAGLAFGTGQSRGRGGQAAVQDHG